MVLKARTVCPTCSSAKITLGRPASDGSTPAMCEGCGTYFNVRTKVA